MTQDPASKATLQYSGSADEALSELSRLLTSGHHTLEEVDLAGIKLNPLRLPLFTSLLPQLATGLRRLELNDNSLGSSGMQELTDALLNGNARLVHLDVSENGLGDTGLYHACRFLQQSHTLVSLCLGSNNLSPRGVPTIAKALETASCPLQRLTLNFNGFGDAGCQLLFSELLRATQRRRQSVARRSSWLASLVQGGSRRGANSRDSGAALDHLCDIDVSDNRIGCGAAAAIAEWAAVARAVRINVSVNDIGPLGATAFASLIAFSPTLECLDIGCNPITTSGVKALAASVASAAALLPDSHFHHLDVISTEIDSDGAESLLHAITVNSHVSVLHFFNNPAIPLELETRLNQTLRNNSERSHPPPTEGLRRRSACHLWWSLCLAGGIAAAMAASVALSRRHRLPR